MDTQFYIMLGVALLSGWDAIVRNISNIKKGVSHWWNALPPLIQLGMVILLIYLIANR